MIPDTNGILTAHGVGKKFGGFVALNNVSVSFAKDRLAAIIGPNGAGKSTFFNVISGAFPPSSGRVSFEGRDITGLPTHAYARLGVAKSFQITSVFPRLTARENVRIAAQMKTKRFDQRGRAQQGSRMAGRDERVRPDRSRRAQRAWDGEQRATEAARMFRGDQRAGPLARLHDDDQLRKRGDRRVPLRERPRLRAEAGRVLRHERAARADPRREGPSASADRREE